MDTRGMNLGDITPEELQEWLSWKKEKEEKGPESKVARLARLEGERKAMALSPELVRLKKEKDAQTPSWLEGPPAYTKVAGSGNLDPAGYLEEDQYNKDMKAAGLMVANQTARSPYEMWKPDGEIPDFVTSQQKTYTDPEKSGRQIVEEEFLKQRALAEQTPSLTPEGPSWLGKIFGEDDDLTLAGGGMAEVGEDPHSLMGRLDFAGITDRVKAEDEYGKLGKSYGYMSGGKKRREQYTLKEKELDVIADKILNEAEGKESNLLASFDDDLGPDAHDVRGEKIDESPSWWSGITGSGDSSSGKGLSPTQKYGAKLIADMFGEKEQAPQQQVVTAPMSAGKNFDMTPFLRDKRPKRERYRNLGLLA